MLVKIDDLVSHRVDDLIITPYKDQKQQENTLYDKKVLEKIIFS